MAGEQTLGKLIVRVLMDATGYEQEAKKVGKTTNSLGKLMGKTANMIGGAFLTATKAGTAALAGFAAASVVVGANFEQAISRVAAVKGIEKTSKDFEALEKQARMLGATTMFSATQAAEGMEELARAGLTTEETIAASNDVLKLAAASGLSLADSASIVTASMAQFSIEASETTRITDVMTAAASNSKFSMQGLGDAMKFAGTTGAAVGMDLEQTVAAVAQFRDLGIDASTAGTNFRATIAALAKPTGEATAALAELGLTVEDVNPSTNDFKDIMLKLGDAGITVDQSIAIFTKRAGTNVQKLVDEMQKSTDGFDGLLDTLKNSAGTTEKQYEIMTDNVIGRSTELKSAIDNVFISLFKTFAEPLTALLVSLAGLVRMVGEELNGTSDEISGNFADSLGFLSSWIDANAEKWAKMAANTITALSEITGLVVRILPMLDEVAFILGVIWAGIKVGQIATVITTVLIPAVSGATLSFSGLAAAVAGATGGLTLIIPVIAALAAAAGVGIAKLEGMANDSARLAEINEVLGTSFTDVNEAMEALEESVNKTTDAYEGLEFQYESVERTARELMVSQIEFLKELGADRSAQESKQLTELTAKLAAMDKAEKEAADKQKARDDQRRDRKKASDKATSDSVQAAIDKELRKVEEAERKKRAEFRKTAEAVAGIVEIREGVRRELAKIGMSELQAIEFSLLERREAIEKAAAKALQVEKLTADQIVAINEDKNEALRLLALIGANERAAVEDKIELEAAEERSEAALAMLEEINDERLTLLQELGKTITEGPLGKAVEVFKKVGEAGVKAFKAIAGAVGMVASMLTDITEGSLAGGLEAIQASLESGTLVRGDQVQSAANEYVEALASGVKDKLKLLIQAIPALLLAVADELPAFIQMIVNQLPKLIDGILEALPVLFEAILEAIPVLFNGILNSLPGLIEGVMALLPDLITGVIALIPDLIIAFVRAIPEIVAALVSHLPEIILALVNGIFTELLPMLPMLAFELVKALLLSIFELLKAIGKFIVETIASVFTKDTDGDGVRDKKDADPNDASISYSGTNYVPATMRMTVHKGEAIVPADRNPFRVDSGTDPALAGAVAFQGGVGAGQGRIALDVIIGGQVVDRIIVDASRQGKAPGITRMLRKEAGTKVGFDAGRFNTWNK